jgi:ATP-dependent Lon protease
MMDEQIFTNKIIKLQDIVKNVIRSNQFYKALGFLEANDLNTCATYAESIYLKLSQLERTIKTFNENEIIVILQDIVREISTLISLYGCDSIETLIHVCIGHKFSIEEKYREKYDLLKTYVKPLRYKILDWRTKLKPSDDSICKTADNFECFDFTNEIFDINFHYRVYGIKIAIHNMEKQHTLVIYGLIEDIMPCFIENKTIKAKIEELKNIAIDERYIQSLTLKELLIYSVKKIHDNYLSYKEQFTCINKKPLSQVISEFGEKELYKKRNMLIMLLINSAENECHYLAYLLYDLLSNDINGIVDTYEQTLIYDSLPYNVKKYFREGMKQIVNYTSKLSSMNVSKLSLEQRICLMKTSDVVKEKAMVKLKEVKMKSEDTGSKAMQFLDGLLKIPFEIYKEEPILKLMNENIKVFSALIKTLTQEDYFLSQHAMPFQIKPQYQYTSLEIQKYLPLLKSGYKQEVHQFLLVETEKYIATCTKTIMIDYAGKLKNILTSEKLTKITGKNLTQLRQEFMICINESLKNEKIDGFLEEILVASKKIKTPFIEDFNKSLIQIEENISKVNTFMLNVSHLLDKAVFGHTSAKRQIERIIGQWINGDITGYCFGFEGPPGVGKTSLAKKGIAQCLLDEHGIARPFAFIAMGGSTNSSTLDGHNYTYVGSTWGRIVDILMDTKIMNPIIFIDELDKVSKTENGKEIIGILTHLIDQTQNDAFQDKYFNGINLNLSKALFIFSYNDADLIDRILLDRIHRIKFDTISVEDKLIITNNFILPEIYKKMGLENMIEISDEVIEYIINDYTAEPGVRKLKELIFEIIGEINLDILKNTLSENNIPIKINVEDIKNKYLNDHMEVRPTKIHPEPMVGVINGMWANSAGKGGILPIEASYYPCNTFLDLKLTGMQGDVMKESMTVAKSLAWSLFSHDAENTQLLREKREKNKNQGIHIHVPEGATPKDGPSAGTAITMVLYSLFSERKIKNDVAITGEICLQGRVSAIGGLELKLLGGIRAGVKTFIYPQENEKDFAKFMKKYGKKSIVADIQFIAVDRIEQVIPLIFI